MSELNETKKLKISQQIQALQTQIQDLRQLIEEKSKYQSEGIGSKFLLAEFDNLVEFWRHTDSRVSSALNMYFTISALSVSGAVFFSQQIENTMLFLISVALIAMILFVAGIFLARQIISTAILKIEYVNSLNLIRCFFVEKDPEIANYLLLPLAGSPVGVDESKEKKISPMRNLLIIIHIWDGMLLGFIVIAGMWLVIPTLSRLIIIAIGIMIALMCIILLRIKAVKRFKEIKIQTRTYNSYAKEQEIF